ncbi:hypothetical protein N8A98_22410 [Devosia neptuniae]|uniref:Uncharacterized protein n=1 Tax=Devosia neptuniae TaxID=191302 RepID=A0ABY6CFE7_9HYPH|nr:hypothetical protein [Devosia neptuniae]UXN69927.1 hypothetical protein N8A98_22410 [Devosia neptuniae]
MKRDIIADGEAMADVEGNDVSYLLGASASDAAFVQWRDSLPDKHWAKYDLSACRLGWEAGRANLSASVVPAAPKYDPLGLIAAGLGKGNPEKPAQKVDPLIAQTEAFEAMQRAFKLACDQPGMPNFLACAAAFDEFERLVKL